MATVRIPDSLYEKSVRLANSRGTTAQQIIIEAVGKEVESNQVASEADLHCGPGRIELPLIHSDQPGTLDLSVFDFDDLLA
jgi:hypothetical protein